MNIDLTIVVFFLGSISLFLFGLKYMSESLQKIFAKNIRSLVSQISNHKIKNIGIGALLASVTQSTSAVAVSTMNFVQNGLYSTKQAFEILLGASIGNTFPIWIYALIGFNINLPIFIALLIIIGFFLIVKKDIQIRNLGEIIIGFSLMFLSFYLFLLISNNFNINHKQFFNEIANYGIAANIMLIVIGGFIAIFIKSVSLMSILTMILAYKGILSLEYSLILILGENIGKTFTTFVAANKADKRVKQVAWFYFFMNIFAALWVFVILTFFSENIYHFFGKIGFSNLIIDVNKTPFAICLFITLYNLANSVFISFFTSKIAYYFNKSLKANEVEKSKKIDNIESGYFNTSEINFMVVKSEILKYSELTQQMFLIIPELLSPKEPEVFKEQLKKLYDLELLNDQFEVDIAKLLIKISKNEISYETQTLVSKMRRITIELEKLGDIALRVGQLIENKNIEKAYFTPEQREKINLLFNMINELFNLLNKNFKKEDMNVDYILAAKMVKNINQLQKNIKNESIEELNIGLYPAKSGFYYNKISNAYEKSGKTILNIFAILSGVEQNK